MTPDLWYKDAIVYCLSVDSFMDGNGDGHGDFVGLTRRLDYLHGLGVSTIWLMPFFASPRRDHGYDVVDHYSVDPRYGTLGDFVDFTHAAERRGMRVLIDLVVNHTSDRHPWFQAARRDPKSKYRDWYVWADERPPNHDDGIVFPGVQESTWAYDKVARRWYFHRFYPFQPDLNTDHPDVQDEILKIMGFWTQLGVAGFRMDAVPFVIAANGPAETARKTPKLDFDMLRRFRERLQWRQGDAILLGEANVLPKYTYDYFGDAGERLHMMFNFTVNQALFHALATADTQRLVRALHDTEAKPASSQWGSFLRNHDELDLGRLPPKQRQRVFDAFAPEPRMQIYGRGIRRRLAPMLGGDRKRLELAYSLMLTLPGTPVLRYGDEIGMGDDLDLSERDAVRTAMQWSTEANGGFTAAARSGVPVIARGPYGYRHVNVALQRRDPGSLLSWMERVLRMRRELPEIGWGDFTVVDVGAPGVLVLRYDWRGDALVVVHNLADAPCEVWLPAQEAGGRRGVLVDLLGDDHLRTDGDGHTLTLDGHGYRWYRIGGHGNVTTARVAA